MYRYIYIYYISEQGVAGGSSLKISTAFSVYRHFIIFYHRLCWSSPLFSWWIPGTARAPKVLCPSSRLSLGIDTLHRRCAESHWNMDQMQSMSTRMHKWPFTSICIRIMYWILLDVCPNYRIHLAEASCGPCGSGTQTSQPEIQIYHRKVPVSEIKWVVFHCQLRLPEVLSEKQSTDNSIKHPTPITASQWPKTRSLPPGRGGWRPDTSARLQTGAASDTVPDKPINDIWVADKITYYSQWTWPK